MAVIVALRAVNPERMHRRNKCPHFRSKQELTWEKGRRASVPPSLKG